MRFLFPILLFFICVPLTVEAQQTSWEITVQGGVSRINYYSSNRVQFESDKEVVPTGEVLLKYSISEILKLRTGLIYERKGGTTSFEERTPQQPDGTGRIITYELYFDYLTIPIMPELTVWQQLPIYIIGGPYLGIPLNVIERINDFNGSSNYNARSPQIGVMGGVGGSVKLNEELSLHLEISRDVSLTKPGADISNETEFKLYGSNLMLGISYDL